LVLYAFLAVLVFAFISPVFFKINKLLADLTQDLIIQEINPVREEQGYLELQTNDKLAKAAQLKAEDMIERDYFDHTGPEGETPWVWLDRVDYQYAAAGENLAVDVADPRVLIQAWMDSPSHAKNILNGYFTDVGIGIARGELAGRKTIVVVMFLGREIPEDIVLGSLAAEELKKDFTRPESLDVPEQAEKVSVSETALVQTVEDEILFKENIVMAGEQVAQEPVQRPETKLFLLSRLPVQSRFALTLFFNVVILWTLITFLITEERSLARVINSMIILALLFFVWLPEIV